MPSRKLENSKNCLRVYSVLRANPKAFLSVTQVHERSGVCHRSNVTKEGGALFEAGVIARETRAKEHYYRLSDNYLENPVAQDLERSLSLLGKVI